MKVLVEKRPIDFELDGGETLKEIVSSLKEWAEKGNNIITDLKLNGKSISIEDANESLIKVEEIETLEVGLKGIEEMAISSLYEACDYLPRLIAKAKETDLAKIEEFVDGIIFLDGIISRAYKYKSFDEESIEKKILRLREIRDLLSEKIKEGARMEVITIIKEEAIPFLEECKVFLPKLIELFIHRRVDPKDLLERLKDTSNKMPEISKQIETLSIDLQTGNEREGMERFQGIIDRLSDMIHLLQEVRISFGLDYRTIKVKDEVVEERSKELDGLLSEIITTFENEDIVMLADLLEYELSPLLSRWKEVISAITHEVEKMIDSS